MFSVHNFACTLVHPCVSMKSWPGGCDTGPMLAGHQRTMPSASTAAQPCIEHNRHTPLCKGKCKAHTHSLYSASPAEGSGSTTLLLRLALRTRPALTGSAMLLSSPAAGVGSTAVVLLWRPRFPAAAATTPPSGLSVAAGTATSAGADAALRLVLASTGSALLVVLREVLRPRRLVLTSAGAASSTGAAVKAAAGMSAGEGRGSALAVALREALRPRPVGLTSAGLVAADSVTAATMSAGEGRGSALLVALREVLRPRRMVACCSTGSATTAAVAAAATTGSEALGLPGMSGCGSAEAVALREVRLPRSAGVVAAAAGCCSCCSRVTRSGGVVLTADSCRTGPDYTGTLTIRAS